MAMACLEYKGVYLAAPADDHKEYAAVPLQNIERQKEPNP